jgi:hypothetical protein
VARGKTVFNLPTAQGGCVECHGQESGKPRLLPTWATRLRDVGTDNREWAMLDRPGKSGWQVDTGVLNGAQIPGGTLKPHDGAFAVLEAAVVGTIAQRLPRIGNSIGEPDRAGRNSDLVAPGVHAQAVRSQELKTAFRGSPEPAANPYYEARVLYGIWAAAPYLHNGSVPTLEDLLKPASERPKSFKVGPEYDPIKVGLAADQTAFDYTFVTTGCEGDQRISGNSNCGHEFGTTLTPDQKRALLEYLKTL